MRRLGRGFEFGKCLPEAIHVRVATANGRLVKFWWKPDDDKKGEWLTSQFDSSPRLPLRFYLEVGLMESYSMQIEDNRHMQTVLAAKGYPLHYSEYDGGHSFLNWSGGMADGLQFLLMPH
jgi:enterochelin esterase-like enzyme